MNKIVKNEETCGGEYRIDNYRITVLNIINSIFNDEKIQDILLKKYYPSLKIEDLNSVEDFLVSKIKNKEKNYALLNFYNDLEDDIELYEGDKVVANRPATEFGLIEGKKYEIIEVNALDLITIINEKGKKEIFTIEYFR